MKIILRKTILEDIQKVSEPQKSQVKFFLIFLAVLTLLKYKNLSE